MTRILRIINRFNLGGPTFNAAYLSRYLPDNYETMLVGGLKEDDEDSSEFIVRDLGIEPVVIPEMRRSISPRSDVLAYRKLKKIIREFKPDIVHTHASKAGMLGRRAAFSLNVPVVVHTFHGHVFHSYFNSITTSTFKSLERNLARRTNCIIAISDRQKEELSVIHRIAPAEKIEVIPLGFDLSRFVKDTDSKRAEFRAEFHLDEDEIAVGIVGRLVPVKNHALFVESIRYLKDHSNKKIRAFIVGDGNERSQIEGIAHGLNLNITPNGYPGKKADITFTSWVRNVDRVYAGLDIVALTSFNEGTPVSLIEAQAAGKPVVTTRVGGIENVVMEGKTALLAPVNNKAVFFDNFLQIVEDEGMRHDMSACGWDYVSEKFHYSRLVSDVDQLYQKLLKGRGI